MSLRTVSCCILMACVFSSCFSVSLDFAGVVGNSGGEGPTVVRSTVGRMGGGVVVDARGRIHTGGGDRILTLSRRGNLLWSTALPEEGWVLGGPTFAIGDNDLYFIAGKPVRREGSFHFLFNPFSLVEANLCRVAMTPDAQPQVLATAKALSWFSSWWNGELTLASAPDGATVYLGSTMAEVKAGNYSRNGYRVQRVHADGTLSTLFEVPESGGRMSVDEAGNFYLGGGGMVRKYDAVGQPLPDFIPAPIPNLGPVATSYIGAVMLTKDAIWDMGHYGFVGRYTRDMRMNPGLLIQWAHALGYVGQIIDAPDGGYFIKSDEALYLAEVVDDRLQLRQRFGSLPEVHALTVTPAGYIGVGAYHHMLWFDFAVDACAAPPVRTEMTTPLGQGIADGDVGVLAYAINPAYISRDYLPAPKGYSLCRFAAEPLVLGSNAPERRANGEYDGRIDAMTRVSNYYFALDGLHARLSRTEVKEPAKLAPISVPLPGAPTSLAALANTYLLVAAAGSVQAFVVAADGALTPKWTLEDEFGEVLHLAVSSNQLLVADTLRHRLCLYTFGDTLDAVPTLVTQYGETDQAGNSIAQFDQPTLVSISGARAVVYDAGNQRIVKLRVGAGAD